MNEVYLAEFVPDKGPIRICHSEGKTELLKLEF